MGLLSKEQGSGVDSFAKEVLGDESFVKRRLRRQNMLRESGMGKTIPRAG